MEMISNDKELITLIASGMGTKQIAEKMKHTTSTIESQRVQLLRRCGVKNAPELVAWAFQKRILKVK